MAFLKIKMQDEQITTPIYNVFIDQYMPKANGIFVKVYLYGYRYCYHGLYEITTKEIAEALDLLESDVLQAWKYWEALGLIRFHENSASGSLDIEYLLVSAPVSQNHTMQLPSTDNTPTTSKRIVLETRPQYSTKEIDIYMEKSPEIQQLFQSAQRHLGKLLTFNDLSTLFSFYDWLRLPINVIDILLSYCVSNNHRSMRYIEKVAVEWSEKGIDTEEKAKQHIRLFNTDYREIMRAFGLGKRDPVAVEEEYMSKWLHIYKLPIPIIKEACKKTIVQTSQPSFPYTDQILSNWFQNNVKTLEDIQKLENAFAQKKQIESQKRLSSSQNQPSRTNRFVNFEQREWDFDEIERLEQEYIQKNLER